MAQQPNSENVPAPLWLPCPAGEFERLSSRLRHRQQRRAVLKGVAGLAAATLTGGGLWLWLRSGSDGGPDYAGIRCEEVQQLAKDFAAGRLSEARRQQVREHVSQCPRCGPLFRSMGLEV